MTGWRWRTRMERKLEGRRTSSKLPKLVELVMGNPLVSAGMVAKTLEVTPQGYATLSGHINEEAFFAASQPTHSRTVTPKRAMSCSVPASSRSKFARLVAT
ncbi:hypothetical protein ELH49_36965 [Rhizobium ruizarguesonis]|nr:hypothetical protein [Rhizobium leguminosarum bv. viciae]TAW02664.1 hypothetical protein ELI25_36325 [Rhizobium ruizarguesonis]TAZ44233.1 hypothetical protein ELH76_35815 [Rhizobium ruizarguesonis]TBB35894.1 hypothetical protein ELH49_36965 [Rhizobium ruizarguesonis]